MVTMRWISTEEVGPTPVERTGRRRHMPFVSFRSPRSPALP